MDSVSFEEGLRRGGGPSRNYVLEAPSASRSPGAERPKWGGDEVGGAGAWGFALDRVPEPQAPSAPASRT